MKDYDEENLREFLPRPEDFGVSFSVYDRVKKEEWEIEEGYARSDSELASDLKRIVITQGFYDVLRGIIEIPFAVFGVLLMALLIPLLIFFLVYPPLFLYENVFQDMGMPSDWGWISVPLWWGFLVWFSASNSNFFPSDSLFSKVFSFFENPFSEFFDKRREQLNAKKKRIEEKRSKIQKEKEDKIRTLRGEAGREMREFEDAFFDYHYKKIVDFYKKNLSQKDRNDSDFAQSAESFSEMIRSMKRLNQFLLTRQFEPEKFARFFERQKGVVTDIDSGRSGVGDTSGKTGKTSVQETAKVVFGGAGRGLYTKRSGEEKRLARHIDWEKVNANKKYVGQKGEQVVLEYERDLLQSAGLSNLSNEVRHISSEEGDGVGYDIVSFFPNGKKKYIEVKSTTGSPTAPYFMSQNELSFLGEHHQDAFVYRVRFDEEGGVFLSIQSAEKCIESSEFIPTQYKVKIKE